MRLTEIDFVTCGIKPKGELFLRASRVFEGAKNLDAKSDRRHDFPLKAACKLIQTYVKGQEYMFRPDRGDTEDWLTKRLVQTFMDIGLQRSLPKALEYRNEIEDSASSLELYAVALDIIREYETYCVHREEINKHVETQRKIINSNRKTFLKALEKRAGQFCKACESVEKLRIDHIRPLSLGGFSVLENLQLLCNFCNGSKCNRTMDYLEHMNKSRRSVIK